MQEIEGHLPMDEIIDRLISAARPDGKTHERLVRYRYMIDRNVFLGEQAKRFIADLVVKYNTAARAAGGQQDAK